MIAAGHLGSHDDFGFVREPRQGRAQRGERGRKQGRSALGAQALRPVGQLARQQSRRDGTVGGWCT